MKEMITNITIQSVALQIALNGAKHAIRSHATLTPDFAEIALNWNHRC
jgi:hypothetical protein